MVINELVKKYGLQSLNFWRGKNGNEIDFILQTKTGILPIEVKSNFGHFNKRSMGFFLQKYHLSDYRVVALEGEKTSRNCSYPWEI